jgi:hypothetical protein
MRYRAEDLRLATATFLTFLDLDEGRLGQALTASRWPGAHQVLLCQPRTGWTLPSGMWRNSGSPTWSAARLAR